MSSDYDSILREKKKSKLEMMTADVDTRGHNYVIIDLFLIIIILVISYIVYYNTVLSGKNIFLNDFKVVSGEYKNILSNLNFDYDINNGYSFSGIVNVSNGDSVNKLDYSINNDGSRTFLNIYNDEVNLKYYNDSSNDYVYYNKVIDKYVMLNGDNIDNYSLDSDSVIGNVSNFLSNKDNYDKSFYLDGEKPVVRLDINLSNNDISSIFGIYLKDEYNVNISLVNHSFSNEIVSIKVIINNKSKDTRDVYLYSNKEIVHTNDGVINEKISISNNNSNFILKYYKDDILYSVLSGTSEGSSYNYLYQVIDSKYNIKLSVSDNNYLIDFNIDTEDKKYNASINLNFNYSNNVVIDEYIDDYINKKELTNEEVSKYDSLLKDVLGFDLMDAISGS